MTSELITQRIKYLIEHGGVLDDPLNDIRKDVRVALWVSATAATVSVIHFAVTLVT